MNRSADKESLSVDSTDNSPTAEKDLDSAVHDLELARTRIKKNRRSAWRIALTAIPIVYDLFLLAQGDQRELIFSRIGFEPGRGKFANRMVAHLLATSKQYSHKLAAVMEWAAEHAVAPSGLPDFIKDNGGVNGCVEALRARHKPEGELVERPIRISWNDEALERARKIRARGTYKKFSLRVRKCPSGLHVFGVRIFD